MASPITYARRDKAAVFLIHGTEDPLISIKQSQSQEKSLKEAGSKVRLLAIEGAGHNIDGDEEKEANAATIEYLGEMLRRSLCGNNVP